MKYKKRRQNTLFYLFVFIFALSCTAKNVAKPYLGLTPPGITPVLFAPDTICRPDRYEQYSVWSADGMQFYYQHTDETWDNSNRFVIENKNGKWGDPVRIDAGDEAPDGIPEMFVSLNWGMTQAFTSDGKRAYVAGTKTKDDNEEPNIWMSEKIDSKWSDPINLDLPLKKDEQIWYISVSNDQDIYLTLGNEEQNRYGIFRAKCVDGRYPEIEDITNKIGAKRCFFHFIDPEEKFILFTIWGGKIGHGQHDIYVSFSEDDKGNLWSKPKNLGPEINTNICDMAPYVTPDGKYLFFSRRGLGRKDKVELADIYWVSSEVIHRLKD